MVRHALFVLGMGLLLVACTKERRSQATASAEPCPVSAWPRYTPMPAPSGPAPTLPAVPTGAAPIVASSIPLAPPTSP